MGSDVVHARLYVAATPEQVRRFRRAVGDGSTASENNTLPKTFPIVWLADKGLQRIVRKQVCFPFIPVHIGQDFNYVDDLQVGRKYRLEIRISVSGAASDRQSLRIRADALDPRTKRRHATITATFLLKRTIG